MPRIASLRMPYSTCLRLGLGLSMVGLAGQTAHADQTWDNGAGNQDWNNPINWTNDTFPNGTTAIVNTATANAFPIISATPTSGTPTDIAIGRGAGTSGRLDQTAGSAGTGNNNWIFIGQDGGNGTFNLANTAASGSGLTGFAQGSGNFTAGRINIGAWSAPGATGTLNVNTSGTLTANHGLGGNGDRSIDIGENGNTGTLNLDNGTVNSTNAIWVGTGTNSVGNINMAGGAINAGGFVRLGAGGGTANVNITGGTFTQATGEMWLGGSGTATVTQSGGTVTTASYLAIGRDAGGNGTYNLSGGIVNAATTGGLTVLGSTRGASGAIDVSGGTFNSNNGILVGEAFFNGSGTGVGSGTLTVSGTGLVSTNTNTANGIFLGVNANSVGTVHLNGGTIQTAIVKMGAGTGTFNFNGGTLKATASSANFMQGLTAANVKANGAVIDTNGFDVTVGQALLNDGGGGLTKTGTGTLTLTGASTYSGATNITTGTVKLGATGSIDNTSGVSVGTGGTFDVTDKAGGYTVTNLTGSGTVLGSLTVSTQLSIGNSPGTVNFENLLLASTATNVHELTGGGTAADLGNVSGTLTLTDGAILDLVQLGTFTLGDKFTVFAYNSGALTGLFRDTGNAVVGDGDYLIDAGGIWQIDYDDTTAGLNGGTGDRFITVTAVPEPAIAALGGLGLLALLRRRRLR